VLRGESGKKICTKAHRLWASPISAVIQGFGTIHEALFAVRATVQPPKQKSQAGLFRPAWCLSTATRKVFFNRPYSGQVGHTVCPVVPVNGVAGPQTAPGPGQVAPVDGCIC